MTALPSQANPGPTSRCSKCGRDDLPLSLIDGEQQCLSCRVDQLANAIVRPSSAGRIVFRAQTQPRTLPLRYTATALQDLTKLPPGTPARLPYACQGCKPGCTFISDLRVVVRELRKQYGNQRLNQEIIAERLSITDRQLRRKYRKHGILGSLPLDFAAE